MSMFTPVGMGGHVSGRTRRRRRRWPVVLVVVAVLAAGAGGGWWYLGRESDAPARAVPTCPPATPSAVALLAPKQVDLNVYNATKRLGLAAGVAKTMSARGYTVRKIDNDPLKRSITGTAEIRYGPRGLQHARTVLAVAAGAEMVPDHRDGRRVDLVLGQKWKALAKKPVAPMVTPPPARGCGGASPGPRSTAEAGRS